MASNERQFLIYFSGLVAILVAAVVLFVTGHHNAASLVGSFGPFLYLMLALAFAALFDPMKKFPNDGPLARLDKVLSFRRK